MNLDSLQKKLNYIFSDISLLQQALTHRSSGPLNYERLEFVGDGILDYVIALTLYHQYPQLPEGELSKIRSALVNQDSLVDIALSLGLSDYLIIGDGEEKSGGRERPSILADSLEAIFAAINLDSDFTHAKDVIENLYTAQLRNAKALVIKDSKSILQEFLQKEHINVPRYTVVELSGPDHDSIFNVECTIPELHIKVMAKGKTKKEASQMAAAKILNLIKDKNVKR